ncbi:hypothetical protein V8F20_010211 [Naviculisporaceae sp. PSN 640]
MASHESPPAVLDITPSDVVFGEATDYQRILAWKLNGADWAAPLTPDEYVERESLLSQTELSTNGGTKYYVLARKDEPDQIVSACELTYKKLLVADKAGTRVIDAYAISSVFTDPVYRGNGMAEHLLGEMQKVVDETTECGALYSDIGRLYYTKLGWKDFKTPQLVFHLDPVANPETTASTAHITLLSEDDIRNLCDSDIRTLTDKFQQLAHSAGDKTYITFLPSFAQCAWHFTRNTYVAKILANGRYPKNRGAKTSDGKSWLYWDHDIREKKLRVLRIVTDASDDIVKRQGDIKALLTAVLAEAEDWGITEVIVWNPYNEVAGAATEVWRDYVSSGHNLQLVFGEREDGAIPSLRWRGGDESRVVVWEDNECFSWC